MVYGDTSGFATLFNNLEISNSKKEKNVTRRIQTYNRIHGESADPWW